MSDRANRAALRSESDKIGTDLTQQERRWPVLPNWTGRVSRRTLGQDALAGLTGASVVIPQGVAFAAIAGLPPEMGMFTAIVPTIVAALTGSSLHAVSGPTTAISVLVFASLSQNLPVGSSEFVSAAVSLALIVGVIQLALGAIRLGAVLDFVSHSVMLGFVSGAAVLIILSQAVKLIGTPTVTTLSDGSFFDDMLRPENWSALATAVTTFVIAAAVRRLHPKLPNYLIGMIGGTVLYHLILPAEAILDTVGTLTKIIPDFSSPGLSVEAISALMPAALAVATVGLLESGSIARSFAKRANVKLDANREFIGQGLSNIAGSFFSCYPSSSSFTRSGLNYDAGAQTPLAAVFAAVFLILILLVASPLMALVPLSAISGLILLIGLRLIDVSHIRKVFRSSRAEAFILITTFAFAAFIDLEEAVYIGVLLSLFVFVYKTSRPFLSVGAPDPQSESRYFRPVSSSHLPECPQLVLARIEGPIYFGSIEAVARELRRIEDERPDQVHMILVILGVGEIDLWGAELLKEEALRRKRRGGSLGLQTKTPKVLNALQRFYVLSELATGKCHPSKGSAIAETVELLDPGICTTCTARIFRECPRRPGGVGK